MEREQNPKSAIETAPVERARNLLTPRKHPDPEDIGAKQVAGIVRDLLSAYDDLAARREQDIREAVEVERHEIVAICDAEIARETPYASGGSNDAHRARCGGLEYAARMVEKRGKAIDPQEIRQQAARDAVEVERTQWWKAARAGGVEIADGGQYRNDIESGIYNALRRAKRDAAEAERERIKRELANWMEPTEKRALGEIQAFISSLPNPQESEGESDGG